MNKSNSLHKIDSVKIQIVNYTLVVGTILGFGSFIASLFSLKTSPLHINNLVDFLILTMFGVVAIMRHTVSIKTKVTIIIAGLFILVTTDLLKLGLFSDNKILFVFIPFYAFLAFNKKNTFVIYAIAVITYMIIGYLYINNFLHPKTDLVARSTATHIWVINILLITIISVVVILVVNQFNNTFTKLVNDLKRRNLESEQNEQHYRDLFNSSSDAVFIHNLDGSVFDVNDTMLKMYGYERNEINKLNLENLSLNNEEYNSSSAFEFISYAFEHGQNRFDWIAKRKDGTTFWVDVMLKKTQIVGKTKMIAVVRDIDEKKKTDIQLAEYSLKLEGLVKDRTQALENSNSELTHTNDQLLNQKEELKKTISQLKNAQNQLIRSEKMASLGILSAGIAHEINNPLNYIKGGALGIETIINDDNYQNKDIKKLLNAINEGVNRAANIVSSLGSFRRETDSHDEQCEINTILNHCLTMLHSKLQQKISITTYFDKKDLITKGNNGKLHQAFLNVLTNSVQAINDKGTITITTKIIESNITVSIEDDGIGIEPGALSKIESPFYTTKDPGEGTGLGLSITYNILNDHDGRIEYFSELNKGTKVIISLPYKN